MSKIEIVSITNIGDGTYNKTDINGKEWKITGTNGTDWQIGLKDDLGAAAAGTGTINLLVKMKGLDDLTLQPGTLTPTADEEFTFKIEVTVS